MTGYDMDRKCRRHVSEKAERNRTERRNERTHHSSRDADRSDHYRSEDKRVHSKDHRASEKNSQKQLVRNAKDNHKSTRKDKSKSYRHISPSLSRREGIHRNSPVELIRKDCRNTDSSSSSNSESDLSDHRGRNNRQKKRKHSEDSYEELSRKKQQIESELSALAEEEEEEEAENQQRHYEKKKSARKQPFRERKVDSRIDRPIKQERFSDDERGNRNGRRSSPKRSNEKMDWGKKSASDPKKPLKDKEKPNFAVSGKLAEDTNTFNGVVIKYNEPKEARKPKRRWRLYPFKGETSLEFIPIHRQSAYLLGRSRLIADIPIDHPSCSKQHAVLQYRLVDYKREDGTVGKRLRPYIIDLDSSNGTFVNNNQIDPRCYVELLEKDVIKFGFSTREYVILHDQSKADSYDDDVIEEND